MNKYQKFISSEKWNIIKHIIVRKRGYKCELCGHIRNIQLHHKNYDHKLGYEREEDLILLCDRCHKVSHQDLECFQR